MSRASWFKVYYLPNWLLSQQIVQIASRIITGFYPSNLHALKYHISIIYMY
jgi:hypothetical protein